MESSISNNQFPELHYSNELRSPAVSSLALTARPCHAKHSCSDLPPAPKGSLRVPPEEAINQIPMSTAMGKDDCLHMLAQSAQQGAQVLGALSRGKHQQGRASSQQAGME